MTSAIFIVGAGIGYWLSSYREQLRDRKEMADSDQYGLHRANGYVFSGAPNPVLPLMLGPKQNYTVPELANNPWVQENWLRLQNEDRYALDRRLDPQFARQIYSVPQRTNQFNLME